MSDDELPEHVVLTDPSAIRAVAHRARMIVIDALYDRGESLTATQAALLTGISPSAMSYHFRALERFGIVKRATAHGDDRQRPWVRAAQNLAIRPNASSGSTSEIVATESIVAWALESDLIMLRGALQRLSGNGEPVALDAVTQHDRSVLLLTVEEATSMLRQFRESSEPYRATSRTNAPSDAGYLSLVVTTAADPTHPGGGTFVRPADPVSS
jgi:DNA-binding transcriptional ArsR family regulator